MRPDLTGHPKAAADLEMRQIWMSKEMWDRDPPFSNGMELILHQKWGFFDSIIPFFLGVVPPGSGWEGGAQAGVLWLWMEMVFPAFQGKN